MSARSMGGSMQVIRPPQRGIFPLDHHSECKAFMQAYIDCLHEHKDVHHKCRDKSRDYLQCRMDCGLMAEENLDHMGYSDEQVVKGAREYDYAKEKAGFVGGSHITKQPKWWWQRWMS